MKNIKSHIQPQYFLRGFLATKKEANHDDFLFVYKKGFPFKTDGTRKENNPSKSGVENTAFVRNFYAFLKEDGTIDTETYERRLEREIENPGNTILDKLRTIQLSKNEIVNVNDFLSDDERKQFSRYVSGMSARSKRSRVQFNNAV